MKSSLKTCLLAVFIMLIIAPVMGAMTLSGVKYMEEVPPGAIVTFPMTLSLADSDPATDYEINVAGFKNGEDGSYVAVGSIDDTSPYTARPLITLDKPTVHLEPGKKEVVTATIKTTSTGDGGRYAIINVRPKPMATGAGASFTTAINVPVMITLKGTEIKETGTIESLGFKTVTAGEPFTVTTTFTNTGNHHYYGAQNNVEIVDEKGEGIKQFGDPLVTAIIPGETVVFTHAFSGMRLGTYTVKSVVFDSEDFTVFDSKSSPITVVPSSGTVQPVDTLTDIPTVQPTVSSSSSGFGLEVALILIGSGVVLLVVGAFLYRRSR